MSATRRRALGESPHLPPFAVSARADRRRAAGRACRCACPRANARRRSGRSSARCVAAARGGGDRRDRRRSTPPPRDGTAAVARRAGATVYQEAELLPRVRAGARQGRCDVARAVGPRRRARCASWTPTPRSSPRTSPAACSGRSCASREVSFVKGFYRRPFGRRRARPRGRRPREPPDGASRARAVLPRARRRAPAARRRGRRAAGAAGAPARSRPATASRSRC